MRLTIRRPQFDWLRWLRYLHHHYPRHHRAPVALLALPMQRLYLVRYWHILGSFAVSTSRFGSGCLFNSWRTPTGAHQVVERLGDRLPLLSRFRYRRYDGTQVRLNPHANISSDDVICTRIIRLAGLDRGHNQGGYRDSYKRCIYIHGTIDEKRVGLPASKGCIRMRNQDLCSVYDQLCIGSLVYVID